MVEEIPTIIDFFIFLAGMDGKRINWNKVTKHYGIETTERLQREISACQ